MISKSRVSPWVLFALCLALVILALPARLHAQATTTASKSADISVFAGGQIANPDYGPENNGGVAFGADFIRHIRFPIDPALEVRANFNSGTYSKEDTFLFGLRASTHLGPLEPYVDFLIGPGTIHYPLSITYPSDNSIVYNFGGGIDLHVIGPWSLKADLQGQHWNTGELQFHPSLGTFGIVYRIPFRAHNSQATLLR